MDFSKPVPIKASARLIYHLGEQLISDELVALLELIKNAYDADATNVQVNVENEVETPYGKGQITINDNGNGMLLSTIVNSFLRLATNYKKENKFSPYYNRKTLGEKGLGRLSFQRLGKYIEVTTIPRLDRLTERKELDKEYIELKQFNRFDIRMDWEGFSADADFEEITADIIPLKDDTKKYGTCIKIMGIRNANFWVLNQEKRKRLQNEILSMTNPFVSEKSNDKFNLKINVNGEEFLIDSIEERVIDSLCDVSVHFSMNKGILKIQSDIKEKYFNRTKTEYFEKQKAINMVPIKDECSYANYRTREIVIDFNKPEDVKIKVNWIKEDIFNKIDDKYAMDFAFSGSFYAVDMQAANRTEISKELFGDSIYIQKNFEKIGQLWKQIAGIYIYRDRFRVLPYGETDWIGFTNLSQKSKATIYKQGNVAGYIKIDGKKSELLKEQTNRQGILQDEYGYNFLTILSRVIAQQIFSWDTKGFRADFAAPKLDKTSKYFYNANKNIMFEKLPDLEKDFKRQGEEFEKFLSDAKDNINQITIFDDTKEQVVNKAVEYKKLSIDYNNELKLKINLLNEKLSEYKTIIPLLGQSIIMETLSHELYRIYSKMSSAIYELDKLCYGNLEDEVKKRMRKVYQELHSELRDLDSQLNHIAPMQRNKLKDEKNISFKSFLENNYVKTGVMSQQLSNSGIKCELLGSDLVYQMSMGNAIVIFDNLVLNSKYWLEKFSVIEPKIVFELSIAPTMSITVWDNGRGIDELVENTLFDPFVSQKESGRGLGLYIVQELLALSGASITLLEERNKYGNRFKFKIEFKECTDEKPQTDIRCFES